MKKIFAILFTAVIFVAAGCLALYVAVTLVAPITFGATIFGKSLNTIAGLFNTPNWVKILLFVALAPAFLFWLVRWTFPQKRRCQAAIIIIILAAFYELVVVITNHNGEIADGSHSAFLFIQKCVVPIKAVDATKTAWFSPSGEPRLYFLCPTTNTWMFYRGAFPGACDPATGVQLQPVTPSIRERWQAEQMREQEAETAKQEETARTELQVQRRQLESVQDSLRKEKEERVRSEQNLLTRLIQDLESKESEFSTFENATAQDTPQQIAGDAGRQLDDAKQKLADAVKVSGNGKPLDLTTLQEMAHAAIQKADKAEQQIRAISAEQMAKEEIAKKAVAAKLAQGNDKWSAMSRGKNESTNSSINQYSDHDFGTKVQDQSMSDLGTGSRWQKRVGKDRQWKSAEAYLQSVTIQIQNTTRRAVLAAC